MKRAWNNFPIWFTRCHFDFDPITSIFYIEASWGGGLRPPVFDLENQCRGGSAELYKGGYLTILEPPPFLFSSRVCLSRQVFFVQAAILTRITYSRGLSLFAAILNFCMACHAGTARYQFSIRTVHIAWRTPTTRHDFPLSSHDFQQHVMNNIFVFKTYEISHPFVYIFWRVHQQPPTNKRHIFTTLHLLKWFFCGLPWATTKGWYVQWTGHFRKVRSKNSKPHTGLDVGL